MLVVKVEVWSAVTGNKTEIARMVIANDGSELSQNWGNYWAKICKGRDTASLNSSMQNMLKGKGEHRTARVEHYPRMKRHVWNLVAGALEALGYEHKAGHNSSVRSRAVRQSENA